MNVAPEPPLLLVTPTYPRALRLSFLRRCAEDFRGVPNLLWVVVEDDAALAADVERSLRESGVTHVYLAHGPTRSWGMPNATEAFSTFAIIVSPALSISPTMTTNINRRCLTSSEGSDG